MRKKKNNFKVVMSKEMLVYRFCVRKNGNDYVGEFNPQICEVRVSRLGKNSFRFSDPDFLHPLLKSFSEHIKIKGKGSDNHSAREAMIDWAAR